MASCPSCRRPVAAARPSCLYCGAPLPPELVAAATAPPAPAAVGESPPVSGGHASRLLLVLDLAGVSVEALARALSLPSYQAALLAKRGGLHLHRVLENALAEEAAARLGAQGIPVVLVPEAEARVRPVRVIGGERAADALELRTEEGDVVVRRGELVLVVRGPIAREYQPTFQRRRVSTARLDDGYRVHLHRRSEPRPLELDAANFELGFTVTGSARLELDAFVEAVGEGVPRDDEFRRLPPALGPAEAEPKGVLAALASMRARTAGEAAARVKVGLPRSDAPQGDATPILDNAAQFRFYSGWRAAVERRRFDTR